MSRARRTRPSTTAAEPAVRGHGCCLRFFWMNVQNLTSTVLRCDPSALPKSYLHYILLYLRLLLSHACGVGGTLPRGREAEDQSAAMQKYRRRRLRQWRLRHWRGKFGPRSTNGLARANWSITTAWILSVRLSVCTASLHLTKNRRCRRCMRHTSMHRCIAL